MPAGNAEDDALWEGLRYEGLSVDVEFVSPGPTFGDVACLCGEAHPRFPPSGRYRFDRLDHLQFTMVDDYFGVPTTGDEGDDVAVWLYPVVGGEPVHHHEGPFDGLRLEYSVLGNPARRAGHFLRCVADIGRMGRRVIYRSRAIDLGTPPDLALLQRDIDTVVAHWRAAGIEVGSDAALEIDY